MFFLNLMYKYISEKRIKIFPNFSFGINKKNIIYEKYLRT